MNWTTQGEKGATKTADKFSYDSASGWTREITYSGPAASVRPKVFEAIKTETAKGNTIRADIKADGAGDQVSANISFPDADPSFGFADATVNQWSLDWQRRELAISAAPSLKDLSKAQIQALNRFTENRGLPEPIVMPGQNVSLCNWPKGEKADKILNICATDAQPNATTTPVAMNVAAELIKKGVTQWATYTPTLSRSGNFRPGSGQIKAVTNVGRVFLTSELISIEGFPVAQAFTLPCAFWIKSSETIKYEGSKMVVDAKYEGMTDYDAPLYERAKGTTLGACCVDGKCSEETKPGCTAKGGEWLGPAHDCNPAFSPCGCLGVFNLMPTLGRCKFIGQDKKLVCVDNVTKDSCLSLKTGFPTWEAGKLCSAP